ncbi:MAG: hypothetical protein V4503_02815 [Gemmatimonadota bacterium]
MRTGIPCRRERSQGRRATIPFLLLVAACYPTTTRPATLPLPSASVSEWELSVREATQELALALDADSIPVRRTEPGDGWLETGWFDAATLRPTQRRPLGDGIVRLRAWIDPGKPNYSSVTVETVYRPFDDPSRESRALEQVVVANHPVALRVNRILAALSKKFGGHSDDDEMVAPPDSAVGLKRKKP